MADRTRGVATKLYADFPATSVLLYSPLGVLLDTITPQSLGNGRYTVDVPAIYHAMSGVYTAEWTNATAIFRQDYTVGDQPLAGMSKFDARVAVARRLGGMKMGRVTYSSPTSIVDSTMIGGTNEHAFWYLMLPPPHPDAGIVFRVTSSNGSALEVSQPFTETPVLGSRFALFEIDPAELDDAIALSVSDTSELARIPVMLSGLEAVNGIASVPAGVTHISQVFDVDGAPLTSASWGMQSGRRLLVSGDLTGAISVLGIRDAGIPVWEDSIIETPSAVLVARSAMVLHAARAGGSAIDVEENLRRQMAAQDEYDRALRRSAGRVPRGMVEVLP